MDECQRFVELLLADDRSWLVEQPGLSDWPDCGRRLRDAMCAWIEQISSCWMAVPLACYDERQRTSDVDGPFEPESALGVDRAGNLTGCLHRLWQVWRHHWQDALRHAGAPVDGFEVAAAVQSGQGFRRYRQVRADGATDQVDQDSDEGSTTVQQLAKGRLRGNPFHDAVLVELAASGDADAIRYLKQTYSYIARQIAASRKRPYEPNDWHSFVNQFISDGRLAKYEGKAGLSIYMSTCYARDDSDPKLGRQSVRSEVRRVSYREQWIALDEVLSDDRRRQLAATLQSTDGDQAAKDDYRGRIRRATGQLTTEEQVAWQRRLEDFRQRKQGILAIDELADVPEQDMEDCNALLSQLLTAGLQELDSRARSSLYQRYRMGTLAKVVAAQLNVSAGQFSRIQQQAVAQLVAYVQDRIQRDDALAECCRECWQLLAGQNALLQLGELLGRSLADLARQAPQPQEPPPRSATTEPDSESNTARPKDSAGKHGAKVAPKKKGGA